MGPRRKYPADAAETFSIRFFAAVLIVIWICYMLFNGYGMTTGSVTLYFLYTLYVHTIGEALVKTILCGGVTLIIRKFVRHDIAIKHNIAAMFGVFMIFVLLSLFQPFEGITIADHSQPAGMTYYSALLKDIRKQELCEVTLPANEVYVGTITKRTNWRTKQTTTTYYVHFRSSDREQYAVAEDERYARLITRICADKVPVTLTYYPNSGYITSVNGVSKRDVSYR